MRLPRAAILATALTICVSAAGANDVRGPAESVIPRLHVPITNLDGMQFTTAIVTFPAGAKAFPHRHGKAFVYAYVLTGSVRSQLDEEAAKIYRAGEEWYEPPGAHHKVTENLSATRPARLLVVFIAPVGAPLKVPD